MFLILFTDGIAIIIFVSILLSLNFIILLYNCLPFLNEDFALAILFSL